MNGLRAPARLALAALLLALPGAQAPGPLPQDPAREALQALRPFVDPMVPDEDQALLLLGTGQATVTLSGRPFTCLGESQVVLEASWKPLGFEPSVTLWYGGAEGTGAYLLPCAQGQLRQPMTWHLQPRSFAGAWSARYEHAAYAWDLWVGAQQPDGTRSVAFRYASTDGLTVHTFDGRATDWR